MLVNNTDRDRKGAFTQVPLAVVLTSDDKAWWTFHGTIVEALNRARTFDLFSPGALDIVGIKQ